MEEYRFSANEPSNLFDVILSYANEKPNWINGTLSKFKSKGMSAKEPDISSIDEVVQTDSNSKKTRYNNTTQRRSDVPIGLSHIIDQKCKVTIEKGITFNVMVMGQIGVGKTTLVNSLFNTNILDTECESNDIHLQKNKFILENESMRLNFTCIETTKYGNQRDNSFVWTPITTYLDEQIKMYIFQEEQPDRTQLIDNRVHCCLYLFELSGDETHPIKLLDILSMKEVSKKCNLIPIISKVDIFTSLELISYKKKIREIFDIQKIEVCKFLKEQEENDHKMVDNDLFPFGIITTQELNENQSLKRKYSWGNIDIENPILNDFTMLKSFLLNEHMISLIESTERYYEYQRSKILNIRIEKGKEIVESIVPLTHKNGLLTEINSSEKELLEKLPKDSNDLISRLNYYNIFNKQKMDEIFIEWTPQYIYKQIQFQQKFNVILQIEEDKFKEWKRYLLEKQTNFNSNIESLYEKLDLMKIQCQELEYQVVTGRSNVPVSLDNHYHHLQYQRPQNETKKRHSLNIDMMSSSPTDHSTTLVAVNVLPTK
ncbi:hypothetical protein C6P45_001254 [Maudiozyma exigua]|uniref:Septin-type G domain-containing protein n=1 Tax=Maudiozyma exigua TaxID=34358 RepID=A0A9P6W198_MAUEX|nr:hypothetical protein C6P45_001254 [Kazachstania exigua]